MFKKTKIIATIGPSSNHPHIISRLIKKGMNVARLNMAHHYDENQLNTLIKNIRIEANKLDKHVGILMDIAGPKIRVDLSNIGDEQIQIVKNHVFNMGYSKMNDIPINMDINFKTLKRSNASVKIDDGNINFKVISIQNNILKLKATNDGVVKSYKGVNFPGIDLEIPSITPKDKKDIKLGIVNQVDWFALSFVRYPDDIKPFLQLYKNNDIIPVIAKIEKPEAMDNLDKIIKTFNGILIARGDLGVEMPLSDLPILQKKITVREQSETYAIVKKCRDEKKPVIIATQMLESMIKNPSPTRAEVNDVANSVYDKVDAVMLSGETAVGENPVETVGIMSDIIKSVEKELKNKDPFNNRIGQSGDNRSAIGKAVKIISENLNIDSIVVMTESGETARVVSHFRTRANVFGLSPHVKICNRMSLIWGIKPIQTKEYISTDDMLINAEKILLDKAFMKKGETFVLTAGVPVGVSGSTNMLQIQKIV